MNRVSHCSECERCQCTDFTYKDYYCCEENDTMRRLASLGVDDPPKTSPVWCPLRCKSDNSGYDFIKMQLDIQLTDKDGKPIKVKSIQPEFISEVFS